MNGLSVCTEIFRIILSHIHFSSGEVLSEYWMGHALTFDLCPFDMEFPNDIVHAINHVLFNMLIFITVEKCYIIYPFISRRRKTKKQKEKRSIQLYLLPGRKKTFIHSLLC